MDSLTCFATILFIRDNDEDIKVTPKLAEKLTKTFLVDHNVTALHDYLSVCCSVNPLFITFQQKLFSCDTAHIIAQNRNISAAT